jgi:hypothetical protein
MTSAAYPLAQRLGGEGRVVDTGRQVGRHDGLEVAVGRGIRTANQKAPRPAPRAGCRSGSGGRPCAGRSVHSDVMVTASRDHGRTWSKPVAATPDDGVISTSSRTSRWMRRAGRGLRLNPLDSTTASHGKYGMWWLGDWQGIASGTGLSISSGTTPVRVTGSLRSSRPDHSSLPFLLLCRCAG